MLAAAASDIVRDDFGGDGDVDDDEEASFGVLVLALALAARPRRRGGLAGPGPAPPPLLVFAAVLRWSCSVSSSTSSSSAPRSVSGSVTAIRSGGGGGAPPSRRKNRRSSPGRGGRCRRLRPFCGPHRPWPGGERTVPPLRPFRGAAPEANGDDDDDDMRPGTSPCVFEDDRWSGPTPKAATGVGPMPQVEEEEDMVETSAATAVAATSGLRLASALL